MKKRMHILMLGIACMFMLCGCGEPLYEMTGEEEDLIVQSAAYMLSKYNIYKKDGANGTLPKQKEEEQTTSPVETEKPDEEDTPGGSHGGSQGQVSGETKGVVTLAESMGCKDSLQVSYLGSEVTDVYREGTYFSMNAEKDRSFIVLRFQIKNPGNADITLKNYEKEIAFYGIFDGELRTPEKQSFIANSLSSFEGTIAAGETKQAVLIFETMKDKAENMQEVKLQVKLDDTLYSVDL